MKKLYAILAAFLVTLTAAIGAPALGTGLSSVLFTNLNKGYFTVTLTAGTAPTNIVWLNLPQHGVQPDLPGDLLWFVGGGLINPTNGYIPYRASATNFANSWLYRIANGTGTDTNLYLGPGTTNVLYRSGSDLLYTNGVTATGTAIKVVNGSGRIATFGLNGSGATFIDSSLGVIMLDAAGSIAGNFSPDTYGTRELGQTNNSAATWGNVDTVGLTINGFRDALTNISRMAVSHTGTNGSVVFDSQGAGSAGTGRGFEFQVDGAPVATIAASSGYTGTGTKVLTDDGTYQDVSAVDSGIWETSGTVVQPAGAAAGYSVNMDRSTVTNLLSTAGVTNATQLDLVGNVAKIRQKSTGFQFLSNETELVSIDISGNMTLPRIYTTDTNVTPSTFAYWNANTNLVTSPFTPQPAINSTNYTVATLPAGAATGDQIYVSDILTPWGTGDRVEWDGSVWRGLRSRIQATASLPQYALYALASGWSGSTTLSLARMGDAMSWVQAGNSSPDGGISSYINNGLSAPGSVAGRSYLSLTTSTSAAGRDEIGAFAWTPTAGEIAITAAEIYIPDLSDDTEKYSIVFGFTDDSASTVGNDAAFFMYDRANALTYLGAGFSTNTWWTISRNGGANVTNDTTVAVAEDTWIRLAVLKTSTYDCYYLNGSLVWSNTTVTVNPVYVGHGGIVKSAGTTSRAVYFDWLYSHVRYAAARTFFP